MCILVLIHSPNPVIKFALDSSLGICYNYLMQTLFFISVGGAIPLLSKEPATATKSHRLNQGKMPHNPLDSSAPLVKKGKQREVPKAKRPTPLKKVLIFLP